MKKVASVLGKVFACLLLYLAIQLPALAGVRTLGEGVVGEGVRLVIFVVSFVVCASVLVYLVRAWGDGETLRHKVFNWQELKWVLLAYLCSLGLTFAFKWLSLFFGAPAANGTSLTIFSSFTQAGWLQATLILLGTSITQPMLEEFLFRGVIQGTLEKYSPMLGLFLSAFLFGYLHNGDFISEHLITGLILGMLYLKRRNLYSCWLVHSLLNTTVTVLYLLLL